MRQLHISVSRFVSISPTTTSTLLLLRLIKLSLFSSFFKKTQQGGNAENRSIVNVSSVAGLHGNVGQTNYSAAKSAVVGMTKTIAKEWGVFGVRANTVAFGFVQTRYIRINISLRITSLISLL